jgi:hypothetical protein
MHPATPPHIRPWPESDDLPEWHARPSQSGGRHGVIHLLLALAIAIALAWAVIDGAAGATLSNTPCFARASAQIASVRPLARFRTRKIPGQPAPSSCRRPPVDPFHQNLALVGE